MSRTRALLALTLGLAMCSTATACVFLYGLAPDHALQPAEDTAVHWSHGFAGDDWTNSSWSCAAGQKQSPISVKTRDHSYQRLPSKALHTQWHYGTFTSNGSNIEIWNSGHTIQVQWPGVTWPSVTTSIAVPADADNTTTVTAVLGITSRTPNVKRVRMTPLQFHFHARSEHTVDGMYFPLELHIVHSIAQADVPGCPASGCLSVTGILIRLVDDSVGDNPLLEDILDAASDIRGSKTYLPAGKTINIDRFITKYDGYVTYEGSLTTPPCTEGLLWHVLMRNMYITTRQLQRYHLLIAAKNCENAPETSHEGRRLHGHAHSHAHAHAHAHSHSHDEDDHAHEDALFPTRRQLLLDELPEEVPEGPYNCTAAGYGQNYRMPQELHGRIVKKSF